MPMNISAHDKETKAFESSMYITLCTPQHFLD